MSTPNDTPETITIQLTQGCSTLIDSIDADLANLKWCVLLSNRYPGVVYGAKRFKSNRTYLLHRVILGRIIGRELQKGEFVDHIDGNPLNNRRSNLRIASNAQNIWNCKPYTKAKHPLKGAWQTKSGRWRSHISVNKKRIDLGFFDTAEEAHEAYKQAAIKYHGEFARWE